MRSKGLNNRVDLSVSGQKIIENSNNQLKYEVIRSEKGTITTLEIGHSADTISGSFKSSHFFFFFIMAHLIRP